MLKQYVVRLREQERRRLRKLVSSGAAPARKLTRARILLKADVGERPGGAGLTDRAIAEALDASPATVQRVRERFCRQGLDAALERSVPDRRYERVITGEVEAHLIALACSEPPAGRARWTLRLLADQLVELELVKRVSHETVRRVLKKTNSSRT